VRSAIFKIKIRRSLILVAKAPSRGDMVIKKLALNKGEGARKLYGTV